MKKENLPKCCKPKKEYNGKNPLKGLMYGLIPHIGCIMFIIASILGATVLMQFFKPLLMNKYIFHYLILISMAFATLSSVIYLRKNKAFSFNGIKSNKRYLAIMYGSTIGINLLLFFFIFPALANVTGGVASESINDFSMLEIKVDIPCPGHAPLISNEVKTVLGVEGSEYSFPNNFKVYYDASQTSKTEILSLEVFGEYPAEVINEEISESLKISDAPTGSCCGSSSCGSNYGEVCGGSCGK